MSSRLAICYAAPGHTLVSTAGSARNILAAAEAMAELADITVAFREIAEPFSSPNFETISIQPRAQAKAARDDVAARGLNPLTHLADLRAIREFAKKNEGVFDVVLEKGWRLSGFLSHAFLAQGTGAALIENDARHWNEPIDSPRVLARYLMHLAAQGVAAYCSRRVPLVIAETEQLRTALIKERKLSPDAVNVVGLGVDHGKFYPRDKSEARRLLGISPDALVMLYVGGMDQYHDLSPLLEALRSVPRSNLEVHLVGDGEYRDRYEALGRESNAKLRFHGQVSHERVPEYIACADVCLAPYQVAGFHGGEVGFSTLKIPEYMACARPVISVPSGSILSLIAHEETGFLFPNTSAQWMEFLEHMPAQKHFESMGTAAAPAVAHLTWDATAEAYLAAAETVLDSR